MKTFETFWFSVLLDLGVFYFSVREELGNADYGYAIQIIALES
jgi:hypothetical protein